MNHSTGTVNYTLGTGSLKAAYLNSVIEIYAGGSKPVSADNAPTGTLVAYGTLNGDTFIAGSPTNGLNFDVVAGKVLFKAVGEVWKIKGLPGLVGTYVMTHFRLKGNAVDAGGVSTTAIRGDGTIGTSTAFDMQVSSTSITANQLITIDEFDLTGK